MSNASQNDHKSKDNPSKTPAAAFTVQKLDEVNLRQIEYYPKKLIMHFMMLSIIERHTTVCSRCCQQMSSDLQRFIYIFFA